MSRPIANIKAEDSPAEILAKCLDIIIQQGPMVSTVGICSNIDLEYCQTSTYNEMFRSVKYLFKDLSEKWEKYSGDSCYPIPSSGIPEQDYFISARHNTLWVGEQGELRMELMKFVKELCEEEASE